MEKEHCTKFCGVLIRFHEFIKSQVLHSAYVTSYPWMYKICHSRFSLHFCYFYGEIFDHFSQTCEVAKFWIIELYLYESDVKHANEQTKYARCGLHVNLNFAQTCHLIPAKFWLLCQVQNFSWHNSKCFTTFFVSQNFLPEKISNNKSSLFYFELKFFGKTYKVFDP